MTLPLWGMPNRVIAVAAGRHVFDLPTGTEWRVFVNSERFADIDERQLRMYHRYEVECPAGECDWQTLLTSPTTSTSVVEETLTACAPTWYEFRTQPGEEILEAHFHFAHHDVFRRQYERSEVERVLREVELLALAADASFINMILVDGKRVDVAIAYSMASHGKAQLAAAKPSEALSALNLAIFAMPSLTELYRLRAQALDALGAPERAARNREIVSELERQHAATRAMRVAGAHNDRGMASAMRGVHKEAIPRFYNNRGMVLCAVERYDEAVLDFTTAICLEPMDPTAYYNRGCAHGFLALDRISELRATEAKTAYAQAIDDFRRAVELDPKQYSGLTETIRQWDEERVMFRAPNKW